MADAKGPVTAAEIARVLSGGLEQGVSDRYGHTIAALVAERTAAAVEEARREEREACATRLRAREAKVQALVEAARTVWVDRSNSHGWKLLRAALDAVKGIQ